MRKPTDVLDIMAAMSVARPRLTMVSRVGHLEPDERYINDVITELGGGGADE